MGEARTGTSKASTLTRAAQPPVPSALRRPIALMVAALALVFSAALLDAAVWQNSYDRARLRGEVMRQSAEIDRLRSQNRRLHNVMRSQRQADPSCQAHVQRLQRELIRAQRVIAAEPDSTLRPFNADLSRHPTIR